MEQQRPPREEATMPGKDMLADVLDQPCVTFDQTCQEANTAFKNALYASQTDESSRTLYERVGRAARCEMRS